MTLNWIIENLKIGGNNTKQKVLLALEQASDNELIELSKSIEMELALRSVERNTKNETIHSLRVR